MCLAGALVASWSLTQEVTGSNILMTKIFIHWIQWKHLGKTQLTDFSGNDSVQNFIWDIDDAGLFTMYIRKMVHYGWVTSSSTIIPLCAQTMAPVPRGGRVSLLNQWVVGFWHDSCFNDNQVTHALYSYIHTYTISNIYTRHLKGFHRFIFTDKTYLKSRILFSSWHHSRGIYATFDASILE